MKVFLVAKPRIDMSNWREFEQSEGLAPIRHWDEEAGSHLVEFAGRLCYMSYGKGRKTTKEFIDNIIQSKHFSVLEHANYTFFITGISRSCSHELVRHRHFSFSQLSQRYVDETDAEVIVPDAIEGNDTFTRAIYAAKTAYGILVSQLTDRFRDEPNPTLRRKMARQAARAVLPNAIETKIAVTGNVRSWREFIEKRATPFADPEIRKLAESIRDALVQASPLLFGDMMNGPFDPATDDPERVMKERERNGQLGLFGKNGTSDSSGTPIDRAGIPRTEDGRGPEDV